MKIEFTKEQFGSLLKSVYLGNWIANAHRTDDMIKEYEEIEDYIFSHAKEFGFDEYVDDEKADKGKFFSTRIFEEEAGMQKLIEEYDEETFWDEIIDRLAIRDLFSQHSRVELEKMDGNERMEKLGILEEKWAEEINEKGIERLEVFKE
ncbi:hypothetical protein EPN15_00600 [Patescibacteria group bacterium]|nr:MAG: hypothetical protein EPN15_00600 [Patescibacteria group bacterium]